MEVTWLTDAEDLVDGDGRVAPRGEARLRRDLHDERLAVVTLLGARSTTRARQRLVGEMLGQPRTDALDAGAGIALLAWGTHVEDDYTMLFLDVGDASSPVVGALCALSSLVLTAVDSETAAANALPAFPPFQETLRLLQRDHSAIEIYEILPTMLSVDVSSDRSLAAVASGPLEAAPSSLADMARLKTLGLRTADAVAAADATAFLASSARVKKLFGAELTGESLLALLQSLARDVADGHEPDLSSAWDEFAERKCRAVADDAMATYVDCIQSSLGGDSSAPIELDAFEKLHDELARLAMDVFHNGTATLQAPSRRAVRTQLKRDLKKKYSDELTALRDHSRRFCDGVRKELWRELSAPWMERDDAGDVSFRAALDAVHQFDALYSERGCGPEKAAVLSDFYRREAVDVFRRLEGIVSRRMTDAHLRELREQLEKDFETKKDALVERFKQEEAQLRVCMTREMEMMQKLHLAKSSRVKIDESEAKRLREEVAELRNAKAALESRHVVLEDASERATQQNASLETKVRDLEHAVRQEMASRAELIDTLAATIKASEDKERQLQDRISELQIEVKEKASRIENELRDLSLQLRKTSEVRLDFEKRDPVATH
jgi:hypothetical protein